MNITFLIGNGFDLSVGADTSYRAFYEWYYKQPSKTESIRRFKKEIQRDIDRGGENWTDFEVGLGQYTSAYSPYDSGEFLDCFDDAQEKMMLFLKEATGGKEVSASEADIARFRDSVLEFYKELPSREQQAIEEALADTSREGIDIENKDVKILSFNYTDLLDKCVKSLLSAPLRVWKTSGGIRHFSVDPEVLHVHGRTDYFPIMGVNDESQIANKSMLDVLDLRKAVIKPESVDALNESWHTQADEQIKRSRIICIMGMSLGQTDAKWWQQIIRWLKEDERRHIILFWFTKEAQTNLSVRKRLAGVARVRERLLRYAENGENIDESVKSRIHVIINTQKFMKISFVQKPELKSLAAGVQQKGAHV